MFNWLKRKSKVALTDDDILASQPPGRIFPWPKGCRIIAVDEVVIAIPLALFEKDRPMSDFLVASKDVKFNVPPDGDKFFVHLLPGHSATLAKSCYAFLVADDGEHRRLKVTHPSKLNTQSQIPHPPEPLR